MPISAEEELDWNRRKLVYLRALGCLDADLSDLDLTIQKSEGVIDTMKQLLQQTFQDRVVGGVSSDMSVIRLS